MDPSFCVIKQSRVLLQHREIDAFPLYSITKTIIAALIFDLGLEIDRPASHWLDESWLPRGNEISLQHLLTTRLAYVIISALPPITPPLRTVERPGPTMNLPNIRCGSRFCSNQNRVGPTQTLAIGR